MGLARDEDATMQCEEKRKYLSEAAALTRVKRTIDTEYRDKNGRLKRTKADINEDEKLGAYLCSNCSFWHVGHYRPPNSCFEMLKRDRVLVFA